MQINQTTRQAGFEPAGSAVIQPAPTEVTGARPMRILLVEDSPDDVELIGITLRKASVEFSLECVETAEDFNARLDASPPDIVLCDYHLPRFSMRQALAIIREERGLDTPFIVVSRLIGEDAAVEAM